MREIKFRAWVNNSKKFEAIEFIGAGQKTFPVYTKGNKYWFPMQGVLEQYVGLKDKNGVEIYENDIVTIPLNEAAYSNNTIAVVSYDENSMLLAGRLVLSRIYTAAEVIGNIHENVYLLVDDIERMIPDDIGNDIHDFLHGGDK